MGKRVVVALGGNALGSYFISWQWSSSGDDSISYGRIFL